MEEDDHGRTTVHRSFSGRTRIVRSVTSLLDNVVCLVARFCYDALAILLQYCSRALCIFSFLLQQFPLALCIFSFLNGLCKFSIPRLSGLLTQC